MTHRVLNHVYRIGVLLFIASMCAGPANGQGIHPYVSGAIEASSVGVHSISSGASLTFDNASDDNMLLGVVGEVGWLLRPNIAIGGQVDLPFRRTTITQSYDYNLEHPSVGRVRFREWNAFAVVRGYVPIARRVRVGGLAGVGMVAESALYQLTSCPFGPLDACSAFLAETESTRLATGLTVGGDIVREATPRISVVPQFRVVWVDRGKIWASRDTSVISLGLNQVSYRAGIGVRVGL